MSHRVISGTARGRKLKMVPGDSTRPILDRIKENLFNILGVWIRETRWLDLFAGTGAVGIEALSRGAEHCVFWELDRLALRTIEENLQLTGLRTKADVEQKNSLIALKNGVISQPFEYIFVAPPQYKEMWKEAILLLDNRPEWLAEDGIVIVQIDPKEYEELLLNHLSLYDSRTYGKTMLCFYELHGE
jgi:16S rRNA (guanine966-N2)-methyltransferase